MKSPLALVILDGWGISPEQRGNALRLAEIPYFTQLQNKNPHTLLAASGERVGLPEGQMGNSEVGHLNIGAGRVVYQDITRISKSIKTGEFYHNSVLMEGMQRVKEKGSSLHLFGLLSDGGVHSHLTHLYALLEMAKRYQLNKVYVHAFLDGRDVPPTSGLGYIESLEQKCSELGVGEIATVSGRYYAMDRDKRWERVEKAFQAIVYGEGERASSASAAVRESYANEVTDEFVVPKVILDDEGQPKGLVRPGDVVIFYNFRADRAREITRSFVDRDFSGFNRKEYPDVHFICMTQYDATIDAPVAFPPQTLENTLGEVLAANGLKQLRIAETEKYAHVTFFFNGGVETPNPGEERILIPSPKVATYDLKPEMSAPEVTERVIAEINRDLYDVIILNYANPDMVGHTGVLEAAIKAVQVVDGCLGRVVDAVLERGGTALVTADHGNAEMMLEDGSDEPHTAHTTNPVPLILVGERFKDVRLREGGSLEDIAPTMLEILGIAKPPEMTGNSLIEEI
ncbi:MAG TPA: 2,3-bisphosphoglycerate-independent phosphoglycerate mutase [Syntrophaceticus sp.]|nr:2,3-bisphosphoglycerate-independent phosphoglycerate mutase [Syntrophaceticus sp.]